MSLSLFIFRAPGAVIRGWSSILEYREPSAQVRVLVNWGVWTFAFQGGLNVNTGCCVQTGSRNALLIERLDLFLPIYGLLEAWKGYKDALEAVTDRGPSLSDNLSSLLVGHAWELLLDLCGCFTFVHSVGTWFFLDATHLDATKF